MLQIIKGPTLLIAGGVALSAGVAPPAKGADSGAPAGWCQAGTKLDVQWNGAWYPATAKQNGAGGCLIGYDGYGANWDERVGPDRAGPRGSHRAFAAGMIPATSGAPAARAASAPVPPGAPASPHPGAYHCVFFANGSLTTVPGFTLRPGGYTHQNGGGGSTRYSGGVIEFVGGPLGGQAGKVEPKVVRMFNERRSRTVYDCDTPR